MLNAEAAGARSLSFPGKPDGAQVVLLSFFATWCPGCVNEMPLLARLDADYRARGLRVLSVSIDRDADSARDLPALLSSAKVRHPVLADPEQKILQKFEGGSVSLPYVFVIDSHGVIVDTHEGFDEETEGALRSKLEALLGDGHSL